MTAIAFMVFGWFKNLNLSFWQVVSLALGSTCLWFWHGKSEAEKSTAAWRQGFQIEQVAFKSEQVNFQSCKSSILSQNESIALLNDQSVELAKSTAARVQSVISKDAADSTIAKKLAATATDGATECKTPNSVMDARSSL